MGEHIDPNFLLVQVVAAPTYTSRELVLYQLQGESDRVTKVVLFLFVSRAGVLFLPLTADCV